MIHGSLFTGIAGFDLGFEAAGVPTVWHSEIDRFCNRVLKHRYPEVRNHGDVAAINGRRIEPVDVVSFGSPCQDLSVAGQRAGLAGARSGLFFEAARVINECRPAFAVWENVPGAFSSDAGRDLWTALYTFRELGANDVAWRVFDSQYAGVPQQRRRIYLVADFRGRRAGEVLFDAEGCGGHPAPGSQAGQELASTLAAGAGRAGRPGGSHDTDLIARSLTTNANRAGGNEAGPAGDETQNMFLIQDARAGVETKGQNGTGAREADVAYTLDSLNTQAVAFQPRVARNGRGSPTDNARPLTARAGEDGRGDSAQMVMLAHSLTSEGADASEDGTGRGTPLVVGPQIRRFTPLECERLQGFPDGWTCLCGAGADVFACACPDGPRYRALGNAVTVPVAEWIARRLVAVTG